MNDIRQYTRDLSVLQRPGAMTALDRLKRDEMFRELENIVPMLLSNDVGFYFLIIVCLDSSIIHTPRW